MNQVSERVWEVLQRHVGREAGLTCRALAAAVQATEREIRKAVTELRESGAPVCGKPRTGYFQARTAEELEDSCAFLRRRAVHSIKLEAGMRKVHMAELIGQLRLDLELPPPEQSELPLGEKR
jgi:hypothetical protein